MRQLILALLVFPVLIYSSCTYDSKVKGSFTQEELDWLVYDEGEEVLFINRQDSTDKLIYTVIDRTDSEQIKQYYPIEAEMVMRNEDTGDELRVFLLKDQMAFKRYVKVGDVYKSLDLVVPQDQVPAGNATFDNVYVVSQVDGDQGNTATVYFNKTNGFLKLLTLDNQWYVMDAKQSISVETGQIN